MKKIIYLGYLGCFTLLTGCNHKNDKEMYTARIDSLQIELVKQKEFLLQLSDADLELEAKIIAQRNKIKELQMCLKDCTENN